MDKRVDRNEKCANPGCGRIADSGNVCCEICELEWMLFRRDLRGGARDKESPAVESR